MVNFGHARYFLDIRKFLSKPGHVFGGTKISWFSRK